jgi:ribosomal protein S1
VVKKNSHGFYELIPAASSEAKKSSKRESIELKEGIRFNGQIKSIKHQCLYISIASEKKSNSSIGRLHMTECSNYNEFSSSAVGDRLDVKILKVTEDKANGRTWIELTRNQKHM